MPEAHEFLRNLALVLGVAAVTTVVFQRLRLPVVFGYLLAGMIVGPHIPIPLVADPRMVQTLSEVGVVLLMFALGLDFSLRKVFQVGARSALIAVPETAVMFALGYLIGRVLGWTALESVYTGAMIAISSTTIIVKAFAERKLTSGFTGTVFGVLVIEDLIAILLLAILTAISVGDRVSVGTIASTAGRLGAFLVALLVIGLLTIPRLTRLVVRLDRPETTVVAAVGLCFGAAYLALSFGYSVALGAFLAGALVAESGEEKTVEALVGPVRDVFAAIFFVSVGMSIAPRLIAEHWVAVVVLTGAVLVTKVVAVSVGAFLTGNGTRVSIQAGMSMAQIGEFSFIIAGVGLTTGATRGFLYPVAVAVSAITTLLTPLLIGAAGPAASWVDRKLPRPLQTFVALYGSWIEGIRRAPADRPTRLRERRIGALLILDLTLLAAIAIGAWFLIERAATALAAATGMSADAGYGVCLAIAVAGSVPFAWGLLRNVRALVQTVVLRALPEVPSGRVDLALAPRRALMVAWQLAAVTLLATPLVALARPIVSPALAITVLLGVMIVLGVVFWRRATNLLGHTQAAAELIVASLSKQMASGTDPAVESAAEPPSGGPPSLQEANQMLPGLGAPVSLRLVDGDYGVGKSLASLDLRDLTDATVLVIVRDDEHVLLPIGRDVLRAGDLLALAGTPAAIDAARDLLTRRPATREVPTA